MEFIGEVCPWNKGVRFLCDKNGSDRGKLHGEYPQFSLLSHTHTHATHKMPSRRTLSREAKIMADNAVCMWKPAQSGKTRAIQDIIREEDGVKNHLNIIICSNNRLLVDQTSARMADELYDTALEDTASTASSDEDGLVSSWRSGTKKTNLSVDALAWKVINDEVSMIVCCAHKKRFQMLKELLEKLQSSRFFDKPVNVWIDEADVSVKHWSGEYDFSKFRCVRQMTLVSATFDAVFDYYDTIRVMPFPHTHPGCYVGLRDCERAPFVAAGDSLAYLKAVLAAHPEMQASGRRLFAPGDIDRSSHAAIADELTARGYIVLLLNGETKAFLFPDGRREPIQDRTSDGHPIEMKDILATAYRKHGMDAYPVAVTGNLCLGRGITFQSEEFLFDDAVIPDNMKDAAAYQCTARVLGNVGTYCGPFTPTVYMVPSLLAAVERQERIATNLAKLVHENGWVNVGADQVRIAAGDAPRMPPAPRAEMNFRVYATEDEARAVLFKLDRNYRWRTRSWSEKKPGFYEAAVGGPADVCSYEHAIRTLPNLTGGKGKTMTRTMYVPCYLKTTDATTLRYVIPIPAETPTDVLAEIDAKFRQADV
jgi:hypothetical protein